MNRSGKFTELLVALSLEMSTLKLIEENKYYFQIRLTLLSFKMFYCIFCHRQIGNNARHLNHIINF